VHLKETTVTAGLCKNITEGHHAGGATVTEFICTLAEGIWSVDMESEKSVTFFPHQCPSVDKVEESAMEDCPGGSATKIGTAINEQSASILKKQKENSAKPVLN
jgi:hypothetical protein